MSSLSRRIVTLILPRRFHRSWLTSFGSVCGGRGILSRRNWRPSGFQRVSTASFFRLRQALAEMLQCISQTPVPVALSFAIVAKYWPPSADHVWWASEVGKRFVSLVTSFKNFMYDNLKNGNSVEFSGFGQFSVSHRDSHIGVNPRTMARITIPELNTPKFKAGEAMK